MVKAFSLFAIVGVAGADTVALSFKDCGSSSTHAKITGLKPDTIDVPGKASIVGSGTVDSDQTSASFTLKVKKSIVPLISGKGSICEDTTIKVPLGAGSFTVKGIDCPIKAGNVDVQVDLDILSMVDDGENDLLDIHIEANADDTGDQVICLDVAASQSLKEKKYARGYVRQPRNGPVAVAEITDEMRAAAPDSLDWSTKGATTPVKDQGNCGSCWAYSATEGIESGLFMATGTLEELSEQQVISCDKVDGGCDGGDLPTAFEYVEKAGGIDTESDYPDSSASSGRTGKCKSFKKKVKVTGYKYAIPPCDSGACKNQKESDMMAALNTYGPLSVCVNAESWDNYSGGIYKKKCSGAERNLDHCVQLVGYDKSANYWKVRNSWAADWGEDGFIRLPMGENACGIADEATYVTAELESSAIEV